MKKIGTHLPGIVLTILYIPVVIICRIISIVIKPRVRKPRSDVPFTYQIGVWPYQEQLTITHLKVNVRESLLNLNKATFLVEVVIEGMLTGQRAEQEPFITSAHLAKQIIRSDYDTVLVEYHITPIIDVRTNYTYTGEPMPFRIRQELQCQSLGWGKKTFHFICKDHIDALFVFHDKSRFSISRVSR